MKNLLLLIATVEALTGLVILLSPTILSRFLFGSDLAGAGVIMSRIGGISLIALGVACWPSSQASMGFYGMTLYSALVGLYLCYVAINGELVGILLWPVALLHLLLAVALVGVRFKERKKAS